MNTQHDFSVTLTRFRRLFLNCVFSQSFANLNLLFFKNLLCRRYSRYRNFAFLSYYFYFSRLMHNNRFATSAARNRDDFGIQHTGGSGTA